MVSENKTKSVTLRRKLRVEARKTRLDKPELTPQGRKETGTQTSINHGTNL